MSLDPYARILAVGDAIVADLNAQAGTIGSGVTAATNATPIQITTDAPHGLASTITVAGEPVGTVTIAGAEGNTAANGTWSIVVIDATNFTLIGSAGNGAYTGGGSWSNVRFAAQRIYNYAYQMTELPILRVNVRILPEFGTDEESRGGERASSKDTYRIDITVERTVSIQKVGALSSVAATDALVSLAKRLAKLYPKSAIIPGTGNPVLVVGNEHELFDELALDEGWFRSRIALTLMEYVDD
jgi:hypothetical protein